MDIRKLLFNAHAMMPFVMAVALALPCVVEAVTIGEAVLQSGAGEPLLAQVDLIVGSNERIDDSCLSLVAPDPLQDNVGSFLTEANLFLKAEGKRQYVDISSRKPFIDAVVRLRLQIKCPGLSGVIKTLVISPSAQKTGKKPIYLASATPAFSDEQRVGKIDAEEIALLLAQQKLLVDGFLTMQHQLKQLQDELAEIKSQLTQSGVNPAVVAAVAAPSAMAQTTAGTQESSPQATIAGKLLQDNPYLHDGILAALGLGLISFALWLGLRFYANIKSHIEIGPQVSAAPAIKLAADVAAAPKRSPSNSIKQPSHITSVPAPAVVLSPKENAAGNVPPAAVHTSPVKVGEKADEEDSMLEEAHLYAANGRLAKAVEILLEIIKRRPSKADAWSLLLSLYSSLGKVAEFENTAREFLKHHKASPLWDGIQVLGRTLDRDNPLYADHNAHVATVSASPDAADLHHPIGDVLMEMGVLSKREIQHYLADFDPKKHGRFGGYLVARKAITLAQLDQALLQQQGVNVEAISDVLPSLQDIENFLANFDPKQHGSVGKFIASHNAVTPEQLSQVLQQHSNRRAAVKNTQVGDSAAVDKAPSS